VIEAADAMQRARQSWREAVDRAEKREMVDNLNHIFATSGSVVVARYKGMTVAQMTDLRRRMGDAGAKFKVIKNRLAKIALDGAADGAGADMFLEPTGIAYGPDPTAAAKVAADFARTNDKFVIIGGLIGKSAIDADGVKALATMPSLDELRAKLMGVLQQPASMLARTLNEPGSKLVRQLNAPAQNLIGVFQAYKQKQEAA
jgi:large subunit ribosomal protein L10